MRPSDAFGCPRPVAAADSDVAATPLASGGNVLAGCSNSAGSVGASDSSSVPGPGIGGPGGSGGSAAPMTTYFLTDEASVDAALDAASRDSESFRTALQFARYIHGKAPNPPQPPATVPAAHHDAASAGSADASTNEHEHDRAGDNNDAPLRPITPDALHHPQARHGHTHSIATSHTPSLPPNFSPLFSQSTTTSLFGTPGPASLSAMSSPSSRRDSLSGSLMTDDALGGDGLISRDASFDMERGAGISLAFGPSISAGGTETTSDATTASSAATASLLLGASTAGLSTVENSMMDSGSAPQLIMPSIKMPSRRPFTETGKNMGRLKVLIAGDSGLGKTSLIKAIVQSCPSIVHVDHIAPLSFSLDGSTRRSSAATVAGSSSTPDGGQNTIRARRKSSRSGRPDTSTSQITEIFASTKPYPAWWSELADEGHLRRRKSLGDNVLDRNICFVDTPGFTQSSSTMDNIMPVIDYVEGYLQKLCTNSLNDADIVGLVSGDGGASVDVVFYLVSGHLKPADIEYLRLLTPLTNVIPVLARADALRSEKDVADAKEKIARQLHEAGIRPFVFSVPTAAHEFALTLASSSGLPQPYAVSSANGSDHDTMDASLLMSPDYVQPLVPTDLAMLVEQVFCPDGISRLRHAAAQKFAKWRRADAPDGGTNQTSRPQSLYRPLTMPHLGAPSSFALARLADHTQREEHLAHVRLANWAAELQRNLDSERARFETLARNERAVWLTERLSECVQDGTLVAVPPAARDVQRQQRKAEKAEKAAKKKKAASRSMSLSRSAFSHEDPLGLLEVTAGLRARGVLVLEVLSSLSVLGGMALWMVRHNYHLQVYGWVMAEWTKLWSGER